MVKAFAAMQFELSVERAARQHEQAVVAEKDAFIAELKELVEKLEGQVHDYRRSMIVPFVVGLGRTHDSSMPELRPRFRFASHGISPCCS